MDNHLPQTTTTPTGWAMLLIEDSGLAPSFMTGDLLLYDPSQHVDPAQLHGCRVVVQSSAGDYCAGILQDADGASVTLDCRRIYWPRAMWPVIWIKAREN
jgi:hypothetical protein